jgi:site-specific DNA-methyltransferase (adenine-specific)
MGNAGNGLSDRNAGAHGHGAGTPLALADWWTRYIVPPGGTVLDPFNGAGTMGIAAIQNGAHYIGIEKMQKYIEVSHERLAKTQPMLAQAAD